MATYKRPKDAYDLLKRLRNSGLNAAERGVLLAQYSYGDKNGTSSFVSEERLAKDLAMSTSAVRRHRKKLREAGWLVEIDRGHNVGKSAQPSEYEIVVPTDRPVPVEKPKRAPTNPHGYNGRKRPPTGQVQPVDLPVTSNQNPSELPVKNNHLHVVPKIDVEDTSNLSGGVGSSGSPTEAERAQVQTSSGLTPSEGTCPGCGHPEGGSHYGHCPQVAAIRSWAGAGYPSEDPWSQPTSARCLVGSPEKP